MVNKEDETKGVKKVTREGGKLEEGAKAKQRVTSKGDKTEKGREKGD